MQNNGINLTPEIFEKSVNLDVEIYQKLSGILINDCLNNNITKNTHFEDTRAHRQYFNKEFFDLNSKVNEKILENKKLFLTLFDSINEERIFFREILSHLLEKSFWKLNIGKNNSNFFLNKIEGVKKEIILKRVEKLEKKEKFLREALKVKNLRILELEDEKENLKNDLTEKRLNLKNYILKKEDQDETPKKTKRKILVNSNGKSLLLKSCVEIKNNFFQNEENVKNIKKEDNEINLNFSKEKIDLNYSEDEDENENLNYSKDAVNQNYSKEIFAKKTRKILKRNRTMKSFNSQKKSEISQIKKVKFEEEKKKNYPNQGSKIKKRKLKKKPKHRKTQSNNFSIINPKNGFVECEINPSDFNIKNHNDNFSTKKINRYQKNS